MPVAVLVVQLLQHTEDTCGLAAVVPACLLVMCTVAKDDGLDALTYSWPYSFFTTLAARISNTELQIILIRLGILEFHERLLSHLQFWELSFFSFTIWMLLLTFQADVDVSRDDNHIADVLQD